MTFENIAHGFLPGCVLSFWRNIPIVDYRRERLTQVNRI